MTTWLKKNCSNFLFAVAVIGAIVGAGAGYARIMGQLAADSARLDAVNQRLTRIEAQVDKLVDQQHAGNPQPGDY
jgi:hypothetical protein